MEGKPLDLTNEQMDILNGFQLYLQEDGRSAKTISSYIADIRAYFQFANRSSGTGPTYITRGLATSFIQSLIQAGYSPATVAKALNSLASFVRYLKAEDIIPFDEKIVDPRRDGIKVARGSEREVSVLTEEQLVALMAYANSPGKLSQRDRLIIHLLVYCGLRLTELCTQKIGDIDVIGRNLKVTGKGQKIREIPLRGEVVALIQEYMKVERAHSRQQKSPYLLVSQRAERLNGSTAEKLLSRVGKTLGFPLHPHMLRHTFCTKLVAAGVPLSTIAQLAGHSSVDTLTRFYVSTSRQDKARAVDLL